MAADDDTFEIDIYGDDTQDQEPPETLQTQSHALEQAQQASTDTRPGMIAQENHEGDGANGVSVEDASHSQQSLKRKAPDEEPEDQLHSMSAEGAQGSHGDDRPIDPGATPAVKLNELHWWTTEEDLRGICARVGAEEELVDMSFAEQKNNGKSKGEVYLEFSSLQAATAVKREVEAMSQVKSGGGVRKTPFTAHFTNLGNPFRTSAGMGAKKENSGRGGAYNSPGSRGNFGSGRGNFGNRGGGFNNMRGGGSMMNQPAAMNPGWGMNGMAGYGAGAFPNPMMNAFGGMGMGYGNMGRGAMMGNMMGRGGFGAMGMGNMNMGMLGGVNGRGGGMMGRGGWNGTGGAAGGFGNGGFGGTAGGVQGQSDGNKRMKMG